LILPTGLGASLFYEMADKLRSVNTKFWDDPFIEELSPSEKLLFLYLLTNPLANILGIYEITIKRICYDTGLGREIILNGLKRFETARKAFYNGNYLILPNWLKNQHLNKNMKIAVSKEFNQLPIELKDNILGNDSEGLGNDSEGFRRVMECLDKYEVEIESEIESEDEKKNTILFSQFWDSYHSITKLKKTDNEAALKYWKKLTDEEKQKAIDNIKPYYDSLSDKKYCKKARTYLSDKNFNDEFKIVPKIVKSENPYKVREDWVEDPYLYKSNANR